MTEPRIPWRGYRLPLSEARDLNRKLRRAGLDAWAADDMTAFDAARTLKHQLEAAIAEASEAP